jgi:alpha-tubulin suppressor-like RCC1 family protein/endonuclease/exonuclease/phosphatase family metal-dependent hydrolase
VPGRRRPLLLATVLCLVGTLATLGVSTALPGAASGATAPAGAAAVAAARSTGLPARPPSRRPARSATVTGLGRASAGGEFSCGIQGRATGALYCWGRNTYGQLGTGGTSPGPDAPARVGSSTWRQVSAGGSTTCGIRADRALLCWGLNHRGQVGDGDRAPVLRPRRIGTQTWTTVATGWFHTCGVTTRGTLLCWGDNARGQLGTGGATGSTRPRRVPGTGWRSVAVGGWTTCATKADRTLWCWGRNDFGQLGLGDQKDRSRPTRVGVATGWSQVSLSWTHGCGRKRSGVVRCWGRNDRGQVGGASAVYVTRPSTVLGGHRAARVAAGEGTSCLVDRAGAAWCWGDDRFGQLGGAQPTPGTHPAPVRVPGTYTGITAGWYHVCAGASGGSSVCWGDNVRGQLGGPVPAARPSAPARPAPGRRGGALSFRIATLNVLNTLHTRPGRHDDAYGPSRVRADWSAQALRNNQVDVAGVQEPDAGQLAALVDGSGGRYQSFPKPSAGDLGVEASIVWDVTRFALVDSGTVRTQHMARKLPRPFVRLRDRATGREFWVFSIHNASNEHQAKRNEAMRVQLAKVQELEEDGIPVFWVGDFNETTVAFCKIVRQTGLESPLGGKVLPDGTCQRPRGLTIDQVYGSRAARWSGFLRDRPPLVGLSTDHPLVLVDVTVP